MTNVQRQPWRKENNKDIFKKLIVYGYRLIPIRDDQ